jgi:hypothetical protein
MHGYSGFDVYNYGGGEMVNIEKKLGLLYIVGGQGPLSFSTINKVATKKMKTAANTTVVLIIPGFTFFVTGDLFFYADLYGKHKSCSYCCI